MTNARRSVISITAVAALTLAAFASLLIISGGPAQIPAVEGQEISQRGPNEREDLAGFPRSLADVGAVHNTCDDDSCTNGNLVVFNSNTRRANATGNTDDLLDDVSPDLDFVASGQNVHASVVNLDDDGRPQNIILENSNMVTIAVVDPDAVQTVSIELSDSMRALGGGTNVSGLPALFTSSGNLSGSHTFVLPAGTTVNGTVAVPIVGGSSAVRVFNGTTDITNQVVVSLVVAGNGNTQVSINFFTIGVPRSDLRVTWPAASPNSTVVVEVDSGSINPPAFLQLTEESDGSGEFFGYLELVSGVHQAYRDQYDSRQTGTTTTVISAVPDVDEGETAATDTDRYVRVSHATDSNPFRLLVNPQDTIQVTYNDKIGVDEDNSHAEVNGDFTGREISVLVDAAPPVVTVTTPENDTADDDRSPSFTGVVTDSGSRASGLQPDLIRLVVPNVQNSDYGSDNVPNPAPLGPLVSADDFNAAPDDPATSASDGDRVTGNDPGNVGIYDSFSTDLGIGNANNAQYHILGDDGDDDGLFATTPNDGVGSASWRYTAGEDFVLGNGLNEDNADALDFTLNYQLIAVDLAGNVGVSDADLENNDNGITYDPFIYKLDVSPPALVEEENPARQSVSIDNGVIFNATQTGLLWTGDELEFDRRAVAVVFNDVINEPTADQFTVAFDASVTPVPAINDVVSPEGDAVDMWMPTGITDDLRNQIKNTVFLVFDQDIPSSATPEITVNGAADEAGNSVAANSDVEAEDGIGPNMVPTLSEGSGSGTDDTGPGNLTNRRINVDIAINEEVSGAPRVFYYRSDTGAQISSGNARPATNGFVHGFNSQQSTDDGGADGYNICVGVELRDQTTQVTTVAGGVRSTDMPADRMGCHEAPGATTFVFDRTDPVVEGGSEVNGTDTLRLPFSVVDPQVSFRLSEEVDPDSIELEFGEQDGSSSDIENVNAVLATTNNRTFTFTPEEDLEFDTTYVLAVTATDLAGNEGDFEVVIPISAREDFVLPLSRGWNLISFPADPENTAVGDVFDNEAVTSVNTFDARNFRLGDQMTTRNPLGNFADDLQVRGGLAYWVFAEDNVDIEVRLVGVGSASDDAPPAPLVIPTVADRFNFVGIVAAASQFTDGDAGESVGRSLDNYLGSAAADAATTILIYESGNLTPVTDSNTRMVETGQGYLIFFSDTGGRTPSIIP